MIEITVPVKLLNGDASVPAHAYVGDGAVDLRSTEDVELKPGARALIKTGLAVEIPLGYAGFVLPRSGLALKHGISVVNAPGLIDSNYRGEIGVILLNTDQAESFHVAKGDRIAQLCIMAVAEANFTVQEQLSDSERNAGGFGSSGV